MLGLRRVGSEITILRPERHILPTWGFSDFEELKSNT